MYYYTNPNGSRLYYLPIDKTAGINNGVINQQQWDLFKSLAFKYLNVNDERGIYDIKPNTCIDLDKSIQDITNEITTLITSNTNYEQKVKFLLHIKNILIGKFNSYDCRNKIEETRFDESGKLITENAIKNEQKILEKSNLENNIYILIGATVFITGMIILIKNKN
jgi:hypothetical protein